ncbi:MAG: DoxX family protein [Nocardioides sp.]
MTNDSEQPGHSASRTRGSSAPESSTRAIEWVGRALLGVPFLLAGAYKFVDPTATGANAEPPGAAFFAAARDTFIFAELATLEVIGGLLLILGYAVPLCTLGLTPLVGTIVIYSAMYVPPGPETALVISIVIGNAVLLWIHRRHYVGLVHWAPAASPTAATGRESLRTAADA